MPTESTSKVTIEHLWRMRAAGEKITVLTAYDWMFASILDAAGVDIFVVGDSLAMSVQGHHSTLPVTANDILYHTKAVSRATKRAMIVADMPFLSYEIAVEDAVRTAGRFVQEGGADAVKVEGGYEIVPVVKALLRAKIPVMGHIGITPQSYLVHSGLKLPGRTASAIEQLLEDCICLDRAGVFAIILEAIPAPLAQLMSRTVKTVLIGIGSGAADGQALVHVDLLGLPTTLPRKPRFVKRYAELSSVVTDAVKSFVQETKAGVFPGPDHVYSVTEEQRQAIQRLESGARQSDTQPPAAVLSSDS